MNDFKEKMKERTMLAAVSVLKSCEGLPEGTEVTIVKRQCKMCYFCGRELQSRLQGEIKG